MILGDGLGDLATRLEVWTDSLEDGVHLRILIVEAMSSMEEVLGDAFGGGRRSVCRGLR